MIRILVISSGIDSATSYYRTIGPLSKLRKENIIYTIADKAGTTDLMGYDILYMERPSEISHLALAKLAKAANIPVWLDYDDDLFNVPACNKSYHQYKSRAGTIMELCRIATAITVSTTAIKASIEHKIPEANVIIIPNAYDSGLFKSVRQVPIEGPRHLINWRGSSTHDKDLFTVQPEIARIAEENPKLLWSFMGHHPEHITKFIKSDNVIVTESLPMVPYMKNMHVLRGLAQIVPLEDCIFNRGKSNIAWIEATHGDMSCIAPNLPEWNKPGVLIYNNPEEFYLLLNKVITEDFNTVIRQYISVSKSYIKMNLELNSVNVQRRWLIETLLTK